MKISTKQSWIISHGTSPVEISMNLNYEFSTKISTLGPSRFSRFKYYLTRENIYRITFTNFPPCLWSDPMFQVERVWIFYNLIIYTWLSSYETLNKNTTMSCYLWFCYTLYFVLQILFTKKNTKIKDGYKYLMPKYNKFQNDYFYRGVLNLPRSSYDHISLHM